MANIRFMPFEERKLRTIVKVSVFAASEVYTSTRVHTKSSEYYMTDHEWTLFTAQLDTAGIDYEVMNNSVIVITKIKENEKKDK